MAAATTTTSSGSFILNIGRTGQALMTSFTKFITYRKIQDRRLENLYATLSITTSTLIELGETVVKYEKDFHLKDEAFKPICETAKANLEKLLILIDEAISSGVWKNDGNLGGQAFTAEADPWLLITVSLGGRDQAKHFWGSLDDTRDSLLELKDIVHYMILKKLSQKTTLNHEQLLEFKNLTTLLPHIVYSVEKAERAKKEEAEFQGERLEKLDKPVMPPFSPFNRRDMDQVSDITLFVDKEPRGRRANISEDYDKRNHSMDSFRSCDSSVVEIRGLPCDMYEEWTLRWNEPLKHPNNSTKLLGFRLTRYIEDPGYWSTDPEFRTQEEMKEHHRLALGTLSPAKHQEMMKKAVQAIPKKGGVAIDHLVWNRTQVSNHEASKAVWQVVSITPEQRYSYSSTKKWGKDPKTTAWVITIRGERIDTVKREQPIRRGDPWAKDPRVGDFLPAARYRNTPQMIYEHESSYSPRGRGRRGEPVIIHPRHPATSRPRRNATIEAIPDEGFRPGTVVIGRIPSKEEAEKRIEEIWAAMISNVENPITDE